MPQKRARPEKGKKYQPDDTPKKPVSAKKDPKKIKEDMDKLLDDIDDVLEENAEEFVRSYVQRGGE